MKKLALLAFCAASVSFGFDANAQLNFFASDTASPVTAIVAVHGHPRDAVKTYDATLAAVSNAGVQATTLVVAPVFQVADAKSEKCRSNGLPSPAVGEPLWTCESWIEGGQSEARDTDSFRAMDALLQEIARRYPSVKAITVAGFSAGAQFVQQYIGFSDAHFPSTLKVRYVVADPGTWLYFDPIVAPMNADCPNANRWKYGTDALPSHFKRTAEQARAVYASADIRYMEAENDNANIRGAYYGILDKSCAANLQGPFRLQRGMAYADYDQRLLAPDKVRRVTVVPSCGHDVSCVFPSKAARDVLFK